MSGNLTVSPGARKEGRALGAGSLLYLPSRLEEAFSENSYSRSRMGCLCRSCRQSYTPLCRKTANHNM